MKPLLLAALLVSLPGCGDDPTGPGEPRAGEALLSTERISALGVTERTSWQAYMTASSAAAAGDRAQIAQEVAEAGLAGWRPAPTGPDFSVTSAMTPAWLAGEPARQLAAIIISYQTASGGWSKAVDYTRARTRGDSFASQDSWSWIATFDNGATTEQLRFLAGVITAGGGDVYLAAFRRGLGYLLAAQFPNGCWPQTYPLEGSYHDAVTFNDGVMVRVLQVIAAASRGAYPFLGAPERQLAGDAFARGLSCIAAAQVRVKGMRTVWAQQHDPLTLAPVAARAYEPAALAALESAPIADLLMQLPAPTRELVDAVHAAAAWWRNTAISGYVYEGGELSTRAGAGSLWARLYEIGSNRPVFGDRDGSVHYDVRELSAERRAGYAWYTTLPAATLARYDGWAAAQPR